MDKTDGVIRKEAVPTFGTNPAIDLQLMKRIRERDAEEVGGGLPLAIGIAVLILVIASIAIEYILS
jgi:hypothetical protein